ncbi:tetratricopeptide repeat protein [Ferdinandcohnia quinoae]|uniref:GTP-binding protein n=1 Tax=Fredinandcohnia quinoae TaxID=2918902 RepID=A0AAW5DV34_9BACI|nr:GTP-binding protein [Fredinandcohnia sp. SECRCQ15]MCH1624495.1 GTP-binding protein [Fredinandcohnia sp. SECRCQ15]
MTSENEFITKTYYQAFILENDKRHPIEILGGAYLAEQEKELYDLSYIRFAQGEVYFHHKDYEAAIYKWENIDNDLAPWAKKNIADAYYELGLLSSAEEVYSSILSNNKILNSEVSLNLFTLYIEGNKLDSAYRVLQETINENPDYPNVTTIAKRFYEEQEDWKNAVELAINEAMRTESIEWFDNLIHYSEACHNRSFSPDIFIPVLRMLYELDQPKFKQLTAFIWQSYQNSSDYLNWLDSINQIMKDLEIDPYDSWHKISNLFEESYIELTTGEYLLSDIGTIMPKLMINWFNTTTTSNGLAAASAIVAWNDIFPSTIKSVIVKEAAIILENVHNDALTFDECYHFMRTMIEWAGKNNIETSSRLLWGFQQLFDIDATNILVLGKGKTTFLNSILGEEVVNSSLTNFMSIQFGVEKEISMVTDSERFPLTTLDNVTNQDSIIEIKLPSSLLQRSGLKLKTTGAYEYFTEKRSTFGYLPVVDGVLIVSSGETLNGNDFDYFAQIQHSVKETPIYFVLPNIFDVEKVKEYFPHAVILDSRAARNNEILSTISSSLVQEKNSNRIEKLLFLLRKMITSLLKKRVEAESKLQESISHNEEFIARLSGFVNSLSDKEIEQGQEIIESFDAVKTEVNKVLSEKIPKILKNCSNYIKEDSNFNLIHIELNERMNEEIQNLIDQEIGPSLSTSLQSWIGNSNQKLSETQAYLDEMKNSLAEGYPDQELHLQCDFKVVEDWHRDINRMTYGIQIEKENIMLRHNPVQVLLKSAGKVLSLLPQKQQVYLYNQYKKYVENESYDDISESIQRKFWLQFDFFKKSLKQDVNLFYQEPLNELSQTIAETMVRVEQNQQSLAKMKSNPEIYYDPLKLFETRLVQYERMNVR